MGQKRDREALERDPDAMDESSGEVCLPLLLLPWPCRSEQGDRIAGSKQGAAY